MAEFHNQELDYLEWHFVNQQGFVFNHMGGTNPDDNVLHRSTCPSLRRVKDKNARTTIKKWCSTSEDELAQKANEDLGEGMWIRCSACFPATQV